MKSRLLRLSLASLLVSMPVGMVAADHHQSVTVEDAIVLADILFGDKERKVFDDYYTRAYHDDHDGKSGKKQKSLPPGLKKKLERGGELPPGWQKKVARGEVLELDLYRSARSLPTDILRRLPRQPEGTSLLQMEDKILRVMDDTRVIVDIFNAVAH